MIGPGSAWITFLALWPGVIVVYWLLGLYLLTMVVNRRRQSVHDVIAQTVVGDWPKVT
jgi:uncharacterized RDD family membrane protein YckC